MKKSLKETIWIKIIRFIFGVDGTIDEYKRQEINRIGNNAFIMTFFYSIITTFIMFAFADQFTHDRFLILLFGNVLCYFFTIPIYIVVSVSKAKLSGIDIDPADYQKEKRKAIIHSFFSAIFVALALFSLDAFVKLIDKSATMKTLLTDLPNLTWYLVAGVVSYVIILFVSLYNLKKAVKKAEEENY